MLHCSDEVSVDHNVVAIVAFKEKWISIRTNINTPRMDRFLLGVGFRNHKYSNHFCLQVCGEKKCENIFFLQFRAAMMRKQRSNIS